MHHGTVHFFPVDLIISSVYIPLFSIHWNFIWWISELFTWKHSNSEVLIYLHLNFNLFTLWLHFWEFQAFFTLLMKSARSSVDAMGFWWTCGFYVVRGFMCMYPLEQCKLTRILSEAEFDYIQESHRKYHLCDI